jgi:hypothetical protein
MIHPATTLHRLLPLALLALTGCHHKVQCDDAALATLEQAITQASPSQRPTLTLAGLAQACPEPASLAKAMAERPTTPPERRARQLTEAVNANVGPWKRACPVGYDIFHQLGPMPPADHAKHLWAHCRMAEYGFATEAEAAGKPLVIHAVLYAGVLEAGKVDPKRRTVILRGLLGL